MGCKGGGENGAADGHGGDKGGTKKEGGDDGADVGFEGGGKGSVATWASESRRPTLLLLEAQSASSLQYWT